MATENIGQSEGETSVQPVDETASVTEPQETTHVEHDHEHEHNHDQEHDHEHNHSHDHGHEDHKRAWYTILNEDWLATIAGLILVVLLVIRVLHAIP